MFNFIMATSKVRDIIDSLEFKLSLSESWRDYNYLNSLSPFKEYLVKLGETRRLYEVELDGLDDDKNLRCVECNGDVRTKLVSHDVYLRGDSTISFFGKFCEGVPYCPNCEDEPEGEGSTFFNYFQ